MSVSIDMVLASPIVRSATGGRADVSSSSSSGVSRVAGDVGDLCGSRMSERSALPSKVYVGKTSGTPASKCVHQ